MLKHLLISTSFLFITNQIGFAQPNFPPEVADSLWSVWEDESKPDTSRLKAIQKYSWSGYLFTKPDSAFYFARLQYDLAKEKGQKKYMSRALNTQGVSFYFRGIYDKAIDYYSKSLKIEEELGNKEGIANTLNNIGLIYNSEGDYIKAIDHYTKSLKIREEIGDKKGIAYSLGNIGNIYKDQGDYAKAIDKYTKGIKIFEEIGAKKGVATCLLNIGLIHFDQGNHAKAIDHYMKSLKTKEELGDKKGIASSLGNIGIVYSYQGDYDKAINYFTKSLRIKEELGDKKGIAGSLNNIGISYYDQGDYTKAIDYHNKSLRIKEELGNKKGIANSLSNIGNIFKEQGDYTNAIDYYTKGLKIYKEIGDKQGIASSLNSMGTIYNYQGDYIKAMDYCSRALNVAQKVGVKGDMKSANRNLFLISLKTDSTEKANNYLNNLLDLRMKDLEVNFPILSESQKEKYFATMNEDFNLFYDFVLEHPENTKQVERAYSNALLTKGLLLKSSTAMRNAILSSGDSVLTEQYYDWIALKRRINKAYSKGEDISKMEEQANALEKKLVRGSHEFSDLKKAQGLSWTDVQKSLKDGESAIEFVHFIHQQDGMDDSKNVVIYAALIIDKNSKHPEMIRLFEEKELEKILGTFPGNNLSYIEQVYGSKKNTKTQLYDLIWKPLEESLKGSKKVYYSPVGLLHKVSFAALAREQDVYLCDSYDIETKSSTGKIALPDNVVFNEKSTMTVFGGVDYNSDSTETELWTYLEGSLTEAEMIKKTLKKREVNYLTGKKASEENFKEVAPKSNIFHIATHGFFYPDPEEVTEDLHTEEESGDLAFRGGRTGFGVETFVKNKNPLMRSGLALAGANDVWSRTKTDGEDGVLTAAEVATVDMRNTDLVVLSACETGLGDIKGSEGVYGLQRSFKMAGVNYLIMSLWQVPDKETAEFMTTFYKHLTRTNNIKQSFNQARQEMRKKYDPYYWAAFILVE